MKSMVEFLSCIKFAIIIVISIMFDFSKNNNTRKTIGHYCKIHFNFDKFLRIFKNSKDSNYCMNVVIYLSKFAKWNQKLILVYNISIMNS